MLSSKNGPTSGSGLSKIANTSREPSRSKPSTATSSPGMYDSTSNNDRSSSSAAVATMARTRSTTAASSAGSSAPNDPPAARHGDRLHDARKRDAREFLPVAQIEHPKRRHPEPGRSQARAREVLAAGEPRCPRGISRETERTGDFPRQLDRRIVRGQHRGKSALAVRDGPDGVERLLVVAEVHPDPFRRDQRVLALRHDKEARPEAGRSSQIRRDAIASRRRYQQRRIARTGQTWAAPQPLQAPVPPVAVNTLLNTKLEPVGRVTKSISTPWRNSNATAST